jgi:hypothetical protein
MPLSRRALAVLAAILVLPAVGFALLGTGGRATAQSTPVTTSPNVEQINSVQGKGTSAISGVFSRTAPFFYVSGLDSVSVYDVSKPEDPQLKGKLVNAIFENEAMTMGERVENGKIRRFVLQGNDLYSVSVNTSELAGVGRPVGQELIVVDVTDPTRPTIIGRTPTAPPRSPVPPGGVTTSTHTVACMDAACSIVYSAGGRGRFSIIDLTDLTKPREIGTAPSPAAGPNAAFATGSGHHWQVDGAGLAAHAGSGGTAIFDITDPRAPLPVNGTNADGTKTPFNDFIHHNVQRPNAQAFRAGNTDFSVANGNVALITEEDYASEGDELACDRAGTFQAWAVPDLDGAAYRAGNPKNEPNKGNIAPLDIINAPNENVGQGLTTPVGGFCSAHWFDFHQSGIVALGHYQQGLRFIDVRNPRDLKQFGFFTGGGSEVWDAYWVPQRQASGAVIPGKKTNLVYSVDAVRGFEVFRVKNLPPDLPVSGDEGSRGSFPAPVGEAPSTGSGSGGGGSAPVAAPCGIPGSKFLKGNIVGRRGVTLRGLAVSRGRCEVRKVEVAVARQVGRKCRFLKANGTFGKRRSCGRPTFIKANGTRRWSYRLNLRLPRGKYLGFSRATDSAGTVESFGGKRKILRGGVR